MSDGKEINKRIRGRVSEQKAAEYLIKKGYKILERNYRAGRIGEIDIIARKDGFICFIEVKSRKNNYYGYPAEAVGYKKQRTIRKVSKCFLKQNYFFDFCVRYDIVEILNGKINHITNAF